MWLLGFCGATSLSREWRYWAAPGHSGAGQPWQVNASGTPAASLAAPQAAPNPGGARANGLRTRQRPDATAPGPTASGRDEAPGRDGASIARATPTGRAPATANPPRYAASDKERQVEA